jgi:hypothetical protein
VTAFGAVVAETPKAGVPTAAFGTPEIDGLDRLAIRAIVRGWCGGVAPTTQALAIGSTAEVTTAGVLAGALVVSEIFQRLRGNFMACRRAIGLNLWQPEQDWLRGQAGKALARLPSAAWIIGLGNLGQAYFWTLGLLPYDRDTLNLVLHDFDVLATSNVSTSLLTTPGLVGSHKSRAMANWAEARGFRTALIERRFAGDFQVTPQEPPIALIGVDNPLARQAIEDVGFERVIEAGLGKGPQDFLGIFTHSLQRARPGSVRHRAPCGPKYRRAIRRRGRCGPGDRGIHARGDGRAPARGHLVPFARSRQPHRHPG